MGTRTDGTATYVYCLVQRPDGRPLSTARPPRGLPGAGPPRLLDAGGGLWVVAAAAPLRRYSADAIERRLRDLEWVSRCAMAHEATVEHFTRAGTVVPMKLFTLFSTEARTLAHVQRSRARLERLIARIAGREEWGVRLSLEETRAARLLTARARRGPRAAGAGTRFLQQRQRAEQAARRLVADARMEADRVFAVLSRRADDARRHTPPAQSPGVRLLLDAAFLVPVRRARAWRAGVAAFARRARRLGLDLALSGPWPPYNFVAESA
jgi:hypothetical protein